MIRVGVIALARQINGGTLPYTFSMIDALAGLPNSEYSLTIFTQYDNHEFDSYLMPKKSISTFFDLIISKIFWTRTGFEDIDIIVAPVHSLKLLLINKPFIFTLHDLQERYFPENFSSLTRAWRKFINYFLSKNAVAILCESSHVKGDIIKFINITPEKILVVPAPPQVSLLRNRDDFQKIDYLPENYILYPAQFWPHKNHLRLIEAFQLVRQSFPEYRLVLTGKKAFDYDKVFKKITDLGLNDLVIHLGYVPQTDMPALYRGATVLVMPTLFESISIPVYEAFALGVPVCASGVVAIPEQIQDAGLLFDPHDVGDIAKKIIALLSSSELQIQCIEKGQKILSMRTTAAYTHQLRNLIDSVV